ncbi:MAG: hypothetical protein J2P45_00255 [Candidatus Dormibacteraeota bacterium]|nr:hypothetical protein [Candidatus Dormibacteraeota bacterium]
MPAHENEARSRRSPRQLARSLLERRGTTIAEELGIDLRRDGPSAWFRLLCVAALLSARIDARIATAAARGLAGAGWTTAGKLAGSSWEERVRVLHEAGYTRYQERTATMLGAMAEQVQERYRGDLRRLRDEARRDPGAERRLLKQLPGLGDVGVDIFFREAQAAWAELRPFADARALRAAKRLGLGQDAGELAGVVAEERLPQLVAALVRTDLEEPKG